MIQKSAERKRVCVFAAFYYDSIEETFNLCDLVTSEYDSETMDSAKYRKAVKHSALKVLKNNPDMELI